MAFQNMGEYYVAHDALYHLRSGSVELEINPNYTERRLITTKTQVLDFDRYKNKHDSYTVDIHIAECDVRNGGDVIVRICGSSENGTISNAFLERNGATTIDLLEVSDDVLPGIYECEQLVFDTVFIGMHPNGQGDIYFFRRNAAVAYIQLHHVVEAAEEVGKEILQGGYVQILGTYGSEVLYYSLDPLAVYNGL
jgi:hypothetical protein